MPTRYRPEEFRERVQNSPPQEKETVTETTIQSITNMFEEAHTSKKDIVIKDTEIVDTLRKMKKGTPLQKATIELRSDVPSIEEYMDDGKVVGAKSTTIGTYCSDGCYNIWFEQSGKKFILAYSKVPLDGNMR